jgi:S-adenosylmethionine uptake transporter
MQKVKVIMTSALHPARSSLWGILFMMINTVALTGLDAMSKILTSDLAPNVVVFLYKFSLFIIVLPWIFSKGFKALKTRRLHFHMLRSIFSVIAAICFFTGLKQVSMPDAAALENIQFLIVSILGILFFKEKCTRAKIVSINAGLLGACIVVNPSLLSFGRETSLSLGVFNPGFAYILLAMLFWSFNTITVKVLGTSESNRTQMFYLLLLSSIISACSAFIEWSDIAVLGYSLKLVPGVADLSNINIKFKHLKFLILMAAFYFIHGLAYFNALKYELSVVIPFRYTKFIFSGICSYLVFAEMPEDPRVYFGYCLIITAGFAMLKEEIKKKRQQRKLFNLAPIKAAA